MSRLLLRGLLLSLLLLGCRTRTLLPPSAPFPSEPQIDLTLRYDPRGGTLEGTAVYTLPTPAGLDPLPFLLAPNLPHYRGWLQVEGASAQPRIQVRRSRPLRLTFRGRTAPVGPEDPLSLFGRWEELSILQTPYPVPAWDAEGPLADLTPPPYADAVTAPAARYRVRLALPAGWTPFAPGREVGRVGDGTWVTRTYITPTPIREFSLAVLRTPRCQSRQVGKRTLRSCTPSGGGEGAPDPELLRRAVQALTVFDEAFGPYPYDRLTLLEVPLWGGGMELSQMVLVHVPEGAPEDFLPFVTAHEVAHQWWYGLVGNDPLADPWLDEGLATYSSLLHARAQDPDLLARERRRLERSLEEAGPLPPLTAPAPQIPRDRYFAAVYARGALFWADLEADLGEEAFRRLMHRYAEAFAFRWVDDEDLAAFLEAEVPEGVRRRLGARYGFPPAP